MVKKIAVSLSKAGDIPESGLDGSTMSTKADLSHSLATAQLAAPSPQTDVRGQAALATEMPPRPVAQSAASEIRARATEDA